MSELELYILLDSNESRMHLMHYVLFINYYSF